MRYIGPISSVFDIATYGLLWFVFAANTVERQALFHSGWFVESLLTQRLIVHMIRTAKVRYLIESRQAMLLAKIGVDFSTETIGLTENSKNVAHGPMASSSASAESVSTIATPPLPSA
jgi:hypothetical protein